MKKLIYILLMLFASVFLTGCFLNNSSNTTVYQKNENALVDNWEIELTSVNKDSSYNHLILKNDLYLKISISLINHSKKTREIDINRMFEIKNDKDIQYYNLDKTNPTSIGPGKSTTINLVYDVVSKANYEMIFYTGVV